MKYPSTEEWRDRKNLDNHDFHKQNDRVLKKYQENNLNNDSNMTLALIGFQLSTIN